MLELALHILDIAENSTRAGARHVYIHLNEDREHDLLNLEITDDGVGMDKESLAKAVDPFYTTKKVRRVGLGLPMLAQAAEMTGGELILTSEPGKGTRLKVTFGLGHIDRQPLGDAAGVMVTLIAGNPDIDFTYCHDHGDQSYLLSTEEIKKEIEDVPINHVEVLKYIRNHIAEGLKEIGSEA
ncbi:MAG TPA: ATP-binding protein [Syntrophus sp. (in: bacteria)]|nr:ATP-binding protein [Syntrophus sp. (in: bacteria)]